MAVLDVGWCHVSLQVAPLVQRLFSSMRPWSQGFELEETKSSQKSLYRWVLNYTSCCRPPSLPLTYSTGLTSAYSGSFEPSFYQGSQDMAYWHDWWNKLSGFQKELILLMSVADGFWSSLTEGQRTVTGSLLAMTHLQTYFHDWHQRLYSCWTHSNISVCQDPFLINNTYNKFQVLLH